MIILSLESATECATAAVINDDRLLGEIIINHKKQHSVIMMPMIDTLLKNCGLTISDVDGFALSNGPGSFTGLRIGMSTIKGLVQSTNKPFIMISSLLGLANNLYNTNGIICSVIDALRGNVYTNSYRFENGVLTALGEDELLSVEEIVEKYKDSNEPITFIGDGTYKHKDKLLSSIKNASIAPCHMNVCKASSIAYAALPKLKEGESDNVLSSAPVYLRKCQAEREYDAKVKKND